VFVLQKPGQLVTSPPWGNAAHAVFTVGATIQLAWNSCFTEEGFQQSIRNFPEHTSPAGGEWAQNGSLASLPLALEMFMLDERMQIRGLLSVWLLPLCHHLLILVWCCRRLGGASSLQVKLCRCYWHQHFNWPRYAFSKLSIAPSRLFHSFLGMLSLRREMKRSILAPLSCFNSWVFVFVVLLVISLNLCLSLLDQCLQLLFLDSPCKWNLEHMLRPLLLFFKQSLLLRSEK